MIAYADIVTGTGVYPAPKTLPGTVVSQAVTRMIKVTGGVATEINPTLIGKYLYANNQCRKITGTRDGVFIYLEKPFDASVNGAFKVVDRMGGQATFINLSANPITVNDGTFAGGVEETFEGTPIWYVLGGNQMQIEVQYP